MNPRNTLWLILAALALFAYIFFFELHPITSGQQSGRKPKLLPDLRPEKVVSIEIFRSNIVMSAERTNDSWRLTRPVTYPAQGTAIENWLAALAALNRRAWISAEDLLAQPHGLADFGLEQPRADIVVQEGDKRIQLRIGDRTPVGEQMYLLLVGSAGVYVTESTLLDRLPSSASDWRDPILLRLANLKFERVSIRSANSELELERNSSNRLWGLTQPRRARVDSTRVNQLLQELQTVRIAEFISDVSPADLEPYGLNSPQTTLTFGRGTNNLLTVDLGVSPTNNPAVVFARRSGNPDIVAVPRGIVEMLRLNYTRFLDPQLVDFPAHGVERIQVRTDASFAVQRQTNGTWRVTAESAAFPADARLVQRFLERLNKLQVIDVAKEVVTEMELPAFALSPPKRQYVLKSAGSSPGETNVVLAQIEFGTNQSNRVFVRRADENSVYTVNRDDLRLLPRDAFEFRDRRIWSFSSNQVAAVTIRLKEQSYRIVRNLQGGWILEAPSQGFLNTFALDDSLFRLGQLSAWEWVAQGEKEPALFGVPQTAHKLAIELNNGDRDKPPILTVEFGGTSPSGGPYAAVNLEGGPTVFEFPIEVFRAYEVVVRGLTTTVGAGP